MILKSFRSMTMLNTVPAKEQTVLINAIRPLYLLSHCSILPPMILKSHQRSFIYAQNMISKSNQFEIWVKPYIYKTLQTIKMFNNYGTIFINSISRYNI